MNKRIIKSNDEGGGASFNTVLYTGSGSDGLAVTGAGFSPDFVWIKPRTQADNHNIYDTLRGVRQQLIPNNTSAESTQPRTLQSFDADGFTLNDDNNVNNSGIDYVAWCWKAAGYANTFNVLENGSTTSSATAAGAGITAGSNTTNYSVSANRDAGFSIVRFNAGSTAWNVGHGLNVAPDVIIEKMYTFGNQWAVYHKDLGTGKFLKLSTTDGEVTDAGAFSSVTDTTWTSYTTLTSGSYIAYCFAEVAGFSKFGSYTGNGSTNGPTITTDFEPAFVMIKSSSDTGAWIMHDNKRGNYNNGDIYARLTAESPNAEIDDYPTNKRIVISSTGFQITNASNSWNGSGRGYIYMAFANQF